MKGKVRVWRATKNIVTQTKLVQKVNNLAIKKSLQIAPLKANFFCYKGGAPVGKIGHYVQKIGILFMFNALFLQMVTKWTLN